MIYLGLTSLFRLKTDLMSGVFMAFFVVWFFLAAWAVILGFFALQTVRITDDAITLCIGPLTLKRISVEQVKVVGFGRMPLNLRALWHPDRATPVLALSFQTTQALNQQGEPLLNDPAIRRRLEDHGCTADSENAAARAFLLKNTRSLPLWIQFSPRVEAALRECLPCAAFLL
jgi:hypothetical protein